LSEKARERLDQGQNVVRGGGPDDLVIDAEVLMDEQVSKSPQLQPRYLWVPLLNLVRHAAYSFPQNGEVINDGSSSLAAVSERSCVVVTSVARDPIDGFEHVGDPTTHVGVRLHERPLQ
jgi:hypothetical protein